MRKKAIYAFLISLSMISAVGCGRTVETEVPDINQEENITEDIDTEIDTEEVLESEQEKTETGWSILENVYTSNGEIIHVPMGSYINGKQTAVCEVKVPSDHIINALYRAEDGETYAFESADGSYAYTLEKAIENGYMEEDYITEELDVRYYGDLDVDGDMGYSISFEVITSDRSTYDAKKEFIENQEEYENVTNGELNGHSYIYYTSEDGMTGNTVLEVDYMIDENNYMIITYSGQRVYSRGLSVLVEDLCNLVVAGDMSADPETEEVDNFSIETEKVTEFASEIQTAVGNKDMEALADLTAFPVYVEVVDGGVVNTRDEFLKLDVNDIITEELMDAVENTDISQLSPSEAGFVMGEVQPNIIFGVVNGELAIQGVNY